MRGAAAAAVLAGSGLGYAFRIEPRWPEIVRVSLPTAWLHGGERLRIVHLSDLHASPAVPLEWLAEVFRLALAEQPDAICLTGDYVTSGTTVDMGLYRKLLRSVAEKVPVFACMGNHDGGKWGKRSGRRESSQAIRTLLAEAGVRVLHNTNEEVVVAGVRAQFVGLGDLWAKEFDPRRAFESLPRQPDCLRVTLSHNPDSKAILQYYHWELLLCGHTHGGQVVIPGYGPPILPIMDRAFAQGLHPYEGRRVYVTRGIGGVYGGVRFYCRPEISVLDLHAAESPHQSS